MSAINGFAIFGRLLQLDAKKRGGRALKSYVMLEITFGFFMEIQKNGWIFYLQTIDVINWSTKIEAEIKNK